MESKGITLLYVDDEPTNLFLFEKSFESLYKVLTARSGQEGLTQLEDHSAEIIVVISDMRMPGMNGIEFIRTAREQHKNIAYFILTAFSSNEEIEHALKDHVIHRFFTKPFNIEEIKGAIDLAIEELQT